MSDLLQQTKAKTSSRKKPAAQSDDRWVIKFGGTDQNRTKLEELVELSHLAGEIKPLLDQHMNVGKQLLFDMWTDKMWTDKKVPDNPRIVLPKVEGGKDTAMEDHRCMLQVKFQSKGLQKVLPDAEDLEDGQTVNELLVQTLMGGSVGLSEKNARAFADSEVTITDRMVLRESIDSMYYGDDPNKKSVATKILQFINQRSKAKTGKGSVDLITDEEMDAIEGGLFVTQQFVALKDGMFERVWNYCESLEQLRKLLLFCNVTVQVSNFEYALSDATKDRIVRATKAAESYLLANSESGK